MKASLVIPSRGGRDRLPRLFDSLERQTYSDWEAIVVIDGDIDGSAEVVEQYSHLPISAIVFEENRGRVAALNAGFEAATGEVLIRCDDDFELSPRHVESHVAPHLAGEVGVIGLPINIAENNAYMRAYGRDADIRFREFARDLDADQRWKLWGGNVSCSREAFDKVGGYSEHYQGYGWEDADFGYRLFQAGIPLVLERGADVRHHMASVTTSIRVGRSLASGRARATFDRLHGVGISGASEPPTNSHWQKLIERISRNSPSTLKHSAKNLDRLLPLLPSSVGRKLVAMLVEGAGWSGYLNAQGQELSGDDVTE